MSFQPSPAPSPTPDPAPSGGAGTPAPGTPPGGQGPAPAGQAGIRQYFPNVPDEHWALMEPHVGQFEGYVTQLQQQVAPFKALADAGYDPQRLQGLVNFERRFDTQPLDVWLEMGEMLQKGQNGQPPAVHPDVDLEYLAAIARGENPPDDPTPGVPPGQPGAQPQGQVPQELLQYIQGLEAQVKQLSEGFQQDRTERQNSIQDQFYDRRLTQMREALTKGGWPAESLTDESLGAHVITYKGFEAATKALLDQRAALLKGFTTAREPNPQATNLPNGVPASPNRDVRSRDRNDPFKTATKSAEARLKRMNQPG